MYLLHLLGGFQLHKGQLLDGLNIRHQLLIAYLALRAPQPVPRSEIAFKLWADSNEEQALTNLRKALHQIKQMITDGEILQIDTRTIQLNRELRLDVTDFTSALDSAERARRANDMDMELATLETASAFYRGDLLPSLYDEWLIPERDRLRDMFMRAMDRLIALLETRKHYRDAIRHAQRLLQTDNLREETYRTLIRLHALNDDRAAALNVYHACAGVLSKELGVEPDSSTRELYERLLKNESQLSRMSFPTMPISHPLVARQAEWKILLGEWKKSSSGELRMVLLSGEAGIGKTRLAEELLHWALRQGIKTVTAACYSAEGQISFAPVTSWLRSMPVQELDVHWQTELSRILPELRDKDVSYQPMTESWQRQVFFESMARALVTQKGPLLLLLDDIQWSDPDTLDWLRYFTRFDKQAKILILATVRIEELLSNANLQSLLVDLRAEDQITELELKRLDKKDTAALGVSLLGKNLSETEALALYRDSEGVPLFVVELANAGFKGGSISRMGSGIGELKAQSSTDLPPRLKAILERRLLRLSSTARTVIESAAVIGREFDITLLRQVSEIDERSTINALDELWRLRMIRERGGSYDFSHDKLREATLAGISPIRLRWLHQRAGEALEAMGTDNEYAAIADHFERAGLNAKAIMHYINAARHAEHLFVLTDALSNLRRATLLETDHAALANLHEQRGDILQMLEQREEAFQAFTQADGLSNDLLQKARLNRKQTTLSARYESDLARTKYQAALAALQLIPRGSEYWAEWLELQLVWIEACYWLHAAEEMQALVEQIREPIEQYGSVLQKLTYRYRLIASAFVKERFRLNQSHMALARETLDMAVESGNPYYISNAKRQFGMVTMCTSQLVESEAAFREVILLCEKNGDQNSMLIARSYLSLMHRRLKRLADVEADTQALIESLQKVSRAPQYEGIAKANQAWLAYREGKSNEAASYAHTALELWKLLPSPYPIQWAALLVLIALAIDVKNIEETFTYAQTLIGPPQQRLIPDVESAFLAALEVDPATKELSLGLFRDAVEKAIEAGYL